MEMFLKKLLNNNVPKSGFTLTEVMIGIMILTVAVVTATNLLVGLMRGNQSNLTSLQAYYLAQEGLEAVRNIRDTNWLHNLNWLGSESQELWGDQLAVGADEEDYYAVNLLNDGFFCDLDSDISSQLVDLKSCSPWNLDSSGEGKIFKFEDGGNIYLSSSGVNQLGETPFYRTVTISPYDMENMKDFVLVKSKVNWELGARKREIVLYEVLSNWKSGAL